METSRYDSVIDVSAWRWKSGEPSERDVLHEFEKCGEILSIYVWRASSSDKKHHFIVFDNPESAAMAHNRFRDDNRFHISTLRTDPALRDRFNRISSMAPQDRASSPADFRYGPLPHSRWSEVHRRTELPWPRSPCRNPVASSSTTLMARKPEDRYPTGPRIRRIKREPEQQPMFRCQALTRPVEGTRPPPRHSPPPAPESVIPAKSSGTERVLLMTIAGHRFTCNLESDLGDSPEAIIVLLQKCDEKACWMMVGAQYRRMRNLKAAEQVMLAFITWMTERGDVFELKPAFLLLSSLYNDQSKATAAGLEGKDILDDLIVRNHQRTAAHYASLGHGLQARDDISSHFTSTTLPRPRDKETVQSTPRQSAPGSGTKGTTEKTAVEIYDSSPLASETGEMEALRLAKRTVEQDYMTERAARLKLEQTLKGKDEELRKTKQLADSMQSQIKREVAGRRKAEDEVKKISGASEEAVKEARLSASKAAILQVASMLTEAANDPSIMAKATI